MKASIIRLGEDEGSSAYVGVDGVIYEAMNCFGYSQTSVREGYEAEIEFSIGYRNEDEDWDEIFSGNPQHLKKLVNTCGWSYRAYGEIISIDPVVVDCGIVQFEDVLFTHDSRCLGEYISFKISRLDVSAK